VLKDKLYIGIDVGGTKIAGSMVTFDGQIVSRVKMSTPLRASSAKIYECVKKTIEDVLTSSGTGIANIASIGAGIPGIVDRDQQSILATPNIDLAGFPLAKELEKDFGVSVCLGNDVNLGLLGERWLGVAKGIDHAVGLFWGTGLGGAVIVNGQLVLGARGAAAELGHVIIDLDGPQSNIGIDGTVESYVSRWALERDIRMAVDRGEPTLALEMLEGDLSRVKSKVLKDCLKQGDPVVTEIMQKASEVLGKFCLSVNHFLNPQMIVLGGGVIEACGDFVLPIVKKIVKADPFFAPFDQCQVVTSNLGDDAVLLGAVALSKMTAGHELYGKHSFYPHIQSNNGQGVIIDNKLYKTNIFVRADGQVKKLGATFDKDIAVLSNKLGVEELRQVCKKHPEILIIASEPKPPVELTKEAMDFLKQKKVKHQFLLREEAISFYNENDCRKAILICQQEDS
jgi:glucokinase